MISLVSHGTTRREAYNLFSQINIRKLGAKQFPKAKMSVDQHSDETNIEE